MDVKQVEWCFPASNGEGDIFMRGWLIDNPVALVQIAHGMSEHSGRYGDFAAALCERGYSVVANDHTGHGRSDQGHFGTFAMKSGGFDFVVEDIHRAFEYAESQIGAHTRILIGHSMGSILAALYADRYNDITALIMIGAPAQVTFSGLAIRYAGGITRRRGHLARSPFLEKLAGSTAGLTGKELEEKKGWLTRDLEIVRKFIEDPLCGFDFTASGYSEMLRGFKRVASRDWGKRIPDIPILMTAGTADSAGKYGKGPTRYAKQLRATGHNNVTLKLFLECRHEILNELNRTEVYEYILNWLNSTK